MLIVVLDYRDGSVHFHKVPDDIEDMEDYLFDILDYDDSCIHWMEVKC